MEEPGGERGGGAAAGPAGVAARHCVFCDYDLRGHAERCACPECGFENDPCSRALRLPGSPRYWRQVYLGSGLILLTMCGWIARGGWRLDWLPAVLVALVLSYLYRATRPRRLILAPAGVLFVRGVRIAVTVPWERVRHIELTRSRLIIFDAAGHKALRLKVDDLGGEESARRCASAIQTAGTSYAAQVEPAAGGVG